MENGTLTVDEYEYLTDLLKARQSTSLQEESDLVNAILIKLELQPLKK